MQRVISDPVIPRSTGCGIAVASCAADVMLSVSILTGSVRLLRSRSSRCNADALANRRPRACPILIGSKRLSGAVRVGATPRAS